MSDGAPRELTTVMFSGGHTVFQCSSATARGAGMGPPALGPEINALSGMRAGRRAKSYSV